jgi:hypothetical protein
VPCSQNLRARQLLTSFHPRDLKSAEHTVQYLANCRIQAQPSLATLLCAARAAFVGLCMRSSSPLPLTANSAFCALSQIFLSKNLPRISPQLPSSPAPNHPPPNRVSQYYFTRLDSARAIP